MATLWLLLSEGSITMAMVTIIPSVAKSILLVVETHLVSHAFPLVVKTVGLIRIDTTVQVMTLGGATSSTNALSNHFSALAVHHTLVSHLLVPVASVFIHLLAFSDTVTVTKPTLRRRRVRLLYGPSMTIILH